MNGVVTANYFRRAGAPERGVAVQLHHPGNQSRDRGFSRAAGGGGRAAASSALGVIDNSSFMHDRVVDGKRDVVRL